MGHLPLPCFSLVPRGKDGTDLLHRAAFNTASGGAKPGSPEKPPLSFLSSQLAAPLSSGCPPGSPYRTTDILLLSPNSFQQRQASPGKGCDAPAHSLRPTEGAVSETLLWLAGQAPLCQLELLPVRQPDGQGGGQRLWPITTQWGEVTAPPPTTSPLLPCLLLFPELPLT